MGLVVMNDALRVGTRESLDQFREIGMRLMMVTGDHAETANGSARSIAIDEVVADALPVEKFAIVQKLKGEGRVVAMCGDGVNDAPALVAADVGIALGERNRGGDWNCWCDVGAVRFPRAGASASTEPHGGANDPPQFDSRVRIQRSRHSHRGGGIDSFRRRHHHFRLVHVRHEHWLAGGCAKFLGIGPAISVGPASRAGSTSAAHLGEIPVAIHSA